MKVSIKFVLQDMWVGLFWKNVYTGSHLPSAIRFYICLLPCLPVILEFER